MPCSLDLKEITRNCSEIAGDTEVAVMTLHFATKCFPLITDRFVPVLLAPSIHSPDRAFQSILRRLALHDSLTSARFAPKMRESQKIECIRLLLTARLAELQQSRFIRVQL
jgi:hypothetical protein